MDEIWLKKLTKTLEKLMQRTKLCIGNNQDIPDIPDIHVFQIWSVEPH